MTSDANDRISEAVEAWVGGLEDRTEGRGPGVLGDWVLVATMVDVNERGEAVADYYLGMKGGSMLPHVVTGLLYRGIDEAEARENTEEE